MSADSETVFLQMEEKIAVAEQGTLATHWCLAWPPPHTAFD